MSLCARTGGRGRGWRDAAGGACAGGEGGLRFLLRGRRPGQSRPVPTHRSLSDPSPPHPSSPLPTRPSRPDPLQVTFVVVAPTFRAKGPRTFRSNKERRQRFIYLRTYAVKKATHDLSGLHRLPRVDPLSPGGGVR